MNNDVTITLESLKTILPAFESNIIEKIEASGTRKVEPEAYDLPTIHITGEIPTEKENVKAKIEYTSKTHNFKCYLKYKLQGSYTMGLPKKNFTIQLYDNEQRTDPHYINFKGWGKDYKFVLKADYDDITHTRNIVCAKLWGKIVESRPDFDSLPEGLKNSPNHGATDGFPVLVYLNGEYQGLYTLTIPKGELMFGMDKNNKNHVALNAEFNDNRDSANQYNPCNFNKPWDGVDGNYWSYEIGSDALDSWMNIYKYRNDINKLEKYLDIQSLIDYYILQEVILGVDGLAKNMMLLTYDKVKWYLSAYDLDGSFGLSGSNYLMDYYDSFLMDISLNAYSELWNVLGMTEERLINRYTELRKSVLSKASIINEFESFINIYGEDVYIKDTIPYPDIPNVSENNIHTLREFIINRLDYLDMDTLGEVLE